MSLHTDFQFSINMTCLLPQTQACSFVLSYIYQALSNSHELSFTFSIFITKSSKPGSTSSVNLNIIIDDNRKIYLSFCFRLGSDCANLGQCFTVFPIHNGFHLNWRKQGAKRIPDLFLQNSPSFRPPS